MSDKKNQPLLKKQDLILITAVIVIAVLLFFASRMMHKSPAEVVEVSVDGTVISTLDLSKDQELTITGASGGFNLLVIRNGEAYVTEASCPDKVCIHQGKIHLDGEIIVCLPNKMTAQIKSAR